MLYQDRVLGRGTIWSRIGARLALIRPGRKYADLDLLSTNRHLRRDLGLDDGQLGFRVRS